jgi:hypothetical protein
MAESALSVAESAVRAAARLSAQGICGAAFDTRVELLRAALAGNARFSPAASDRGLFIEMAREARADYGVATELFILCGRDAAERIVNWDYGCEDGIEKQLEVFELLVAS